MVSIQIAVDEFAQRLGFQICARGRGVIPVTDGDTNRPGLQFSGYFGHFTANRVQLIGNAEMHYLLEIPDHILSERTELFCSQEEIPCVVFAQGFDPLPTLLICMEQHGIPVFRSDRSTTKTGHAITNYLDRLLAPTITRHGVLMDVYGVGVMLSGESGMGKSETALEMIKRGHRLVADDVMEIRRVAENRLSGAAPALTRHLMEIRGIGIIDVRYMYGVGAVIPEKSIDLVMEMEMWEEGRSYERLGLDEDFVEILGVKVPKLIMPVRPGRNLAIIVEVAARNYRLKKLGYDAAREFDKRWMQEIESR